MGESWPDPAPDAGSDEDVWAGIIASFHGPSALPPGEHAPQPPEGTAPRPPPPPGEPAPQPPPPPAGTAPAAGAPETTRPGTTRPGADAGRPATAEPTRPTDLSDLSGLGDRTGLGDRADPIDPTDPDNPADRADRDPARSDADAPPPPDPITAWRQHVPPEEPVEHFVPPEPPPLPQTDAITRAAWVGVLGAPALFVLAGLLNWHLPWWGAALGVLGFVGGFALLVWRMRDGEPGAGPDDGAVV